MFRRIHVSGPYTTILQAHVDLDRIIDLLGLAFRPGQRSAAIALVEPERKC